MKKYLLAEILFLSRRDKKHEKKYLILTLLELILLKKVKNQNTYRLKCKQRTNNKLITPKPLANLLITQKLILFSL